MAVPYASTSQTYVAPPSAAPVQGSTLFEAWPETKELSRDDMEALLRDEHYFDAFFNSLPRVKAYHDAFDALLKHNEEITAANMAMKPRLDELRAETASAFQAATDLKARWAQLEIDQAQAYKRFSPDTQLSRLRHATSDQDRFSETVAHEFQQGQGALDDDAALARYRDLRRVWHRRALTSELWSQGKVRWN